MDLVSAAQIKGTMESMAPSDADIKSATDALKRWGLLTPIQYGPNYKGVVVSDGVFSVPMFLTFLQ